MICHHVSTLLANLRSTRSKVNEGSMSEEQKEKISAFLKQQDIAYCKPGHKDTVYMEKDALSTLCSMSKMMLMYHITHETTSC